MEFKWVRKIPSRCDELVAVGWRTFTAKREVGESPEANAAFRQSADTLMLLRKRLADSELFTARALHRRVGIWQKHRVYAKRCRITKTCVSQKCHKSVTFPSHKPASSAETEAV